MKLTLAFFLLLSIGVKGQTGGIDTALFTSGNIFIARAHQEEYLDTVRVLLLMTDTFRTYRYKGTHTLGYRYVSSNQDTSIWLDPHSYMETFTEIGLAVRRHYDPGWLYGSGMLVEILHYTNLQHQWIEYFVWLSKTINP